MMAEPNRPYDEVQHDPVSEPPTILPDTDIEEIIDEISDWFGQNFENPAEHTPYESAEGGYQYIWGGPYDTREIIEYFFSGDLTDEQIEEVADAIELEGTDWVPNIGRRQPPERDDDQYTLPLDAAELHSQLLRQVAQAEAHLAELRRLQSEGAIRGIGHNNPPEAIEDLPATQKDIEDLRAAFETLKSQPIEPDAAGQQATREVRSTLLTVAGKIAMWAGGQANTFVSKAVEEAGKETGKWIFRAAGAYIVLKDHLHQIAETITQWLHVLHLPF